VKNYMLKAENAIYYACGYSCDNALYLSLGAEAFFITDSRYTLDAKEHVVDAQVVIASDLYAKAVEIMKRTNIKKIAFDPKEWSLYGFNRLQESLKINFKSVLDLSHKKRLIKTDQELKIIAKAVQLGAQAFDVFSKAISNEAMGENEYQLTYRAQGVLSDFGRYDLSFDPIVAINANAAKPHALPTQTTLCDGDLLLVDAGLKYQHYCSDRTRTVCVGEGVHFGTTQHFSSKRRQKAYDCVLKAHDRAISKARSGMKAKEVDALAREVIEKAGFGEYFVHSTGHGVGLDIHEMPYISSASQTIIEDGMVYTIEPGIYIPNGFGIRIEDMVAMVDGRAKVL
jgi:Xaa-Pro aminopeptidase